MKTLLTILFTFLTFTQDHFTDLSRLQGVWRMETGKGYIYESWRSISELELVGKSYQLNGDDTIVFEKIRLVKRGSAVAYIPVVMDQNEGKPVEFRLVSAEQKKYIFENREHDFPQRIIYCLVTPDSVVARIEGLRDGKPDGANYYFSRVR
ncbi:MAG TPA: DUF6265 family protein [Ohtaekwangia sp.]|nr:DUF6265 family protein [Ohtaekwangia sp.]